MPFEQPGDGAFVHLVAEVGFKCPLDFAGGGNFPALRSAEKGR